MHEAVRAFVANACAMPEVRPADHLANERTFLAYVRTALSLMAFGFVIAKFGLFVRLLPAGSVPAALSAPSGARLGIAFAAFGAAMAVVGTARYLSGERAIESGSFRPAKRTAMVTGAVTFILGIVVVAKLLRLL